MSKENEQLHLKYYELESSLSTTFYIINPDNFGYLKGFSELAEIAVTDYPELDPDEITIDGIIGKWITDLSNETDPYWKKAFKDRDGKEFEMEFYAISFILDDIKPRDDYRPLSDLFPLGYKYFK